MGNDVPNGKKRVSRRKVRFGASSAPKGTGYKRKVAMMQATPLRCGFAAGGGARPQSGRGRGEGSSPTPKGRGKGEGVKLA